VAMLAGIVLTHEQYSAWQLAGAAAVLLSVILVWRAKSTAPRPAGSWGWKKMPAVETNRLAEENVEL
jgi:hypothetical protein